MNRYERKLDKQLTHLAHVTKKLKKNPLCWLKHQLRFGCKFRANLLQHVNDIRMLIEFGLTNGGRCMILSETEAS